MSDNYTSKNEDVWSYDDDDAYSSVPSTSFVKSTVGAIEDEVGIIGDEIGGKQDGIWQQDDPPADPVVNELWLDTSSIPYKLMRWDGVEWIKATPTLPSDIGATTQEYVDQKVAEGVGSGIPISSTPPATPSVDQLWIDTSVVPNQLKRWNGTQWVKITPTIPSDIGAIDSTTLNNSLALKEGTIVKSNTSPSSPVLNQIWIDTSVTPSVWKQYNGSTWVKMTRSDLADLTGTISASQITTATLTAVGIDAAAITTGTLSAGRIGVGTITANKILVGDYTSLAQINEKLGAATNIPSSVFGGSLVNGLAEITKGATANQYLMLSDYQANVFKTNDEVYYEFDIWTGAATTGLFFAVFCYSAAKGALGNNTASITKTAGGWSTVSGSMKLTHTGFNTAALMLVGIQDTNVTKIDVALKNISIFKKSGANLIVDGTITGAKLVAGTITATQIAGSTITGDKIAANTITAANIAADTIGAGQIAAGSITANELAANSVTATQIAANTITTAMISAVGLHASVITGGTISADRISGGTLTGVTIQTPKSQGAHMTLVGGTIQYYYNDVFQGSISEGLMNSNGSILLDSTGNVTLWSGGAGYQIQLWGETRCDNLIYMQNYVVATQNWVASNGFATQSYVTSQGYYSYGTSPTFNTIDAAGGFRVNTGGTINSVGTYNTTTSSSANMHVSSGGLFYRFSSSIKYKEQVEDLWDTEYNKVLDLRPVWYRSKGEDDRKDWSHIGLIAEEVAEIEPRLVHFRDWYDEEGNCIPDSELEPEGVQYDRIGVMLIPIVKELKEKIRILEERLNGN